MGKTDFIFSIFNHLVAGNFDPRDEVRGVSGGGECSRAGQNLVNRTAVDAT